MEPITEVVKNLSSLEQIIELIKWVLQWAGEDKNGGRGFLMFILATLGLGASVGTIYIIFHYVTKLITSIVSHLKGLIKITTVANKVQMSDLRSEIQNDIRSVNDSVNQFKDEILRKKQKQIKELESNLKSAILEIEKLESKES